MSSTPLHLLQQWAKTKPSIAALYGRERDGSWREYTWHQYFETVREVAKGLIALGVQPADRVALLGKNTPEWLICQAGVVAARAVAAPIYPTNPPEQVAYILNHCGARVVICDGQDQLTKILSSVSAKTVTLDRVVNLGVVRDNRDLVISLSQLTALGRQQPDVLLNARISAITADQIGLLLYSAGTTGPPKAAPLSHKAQLDVANAMLRRFPRLRQDYRVVSYLPLNHAAEQVFSNLLPLVTGGVTYFCPELSEVTSYLREIQPTFFFGVPAFWSQVERRLKREFEQQLPHQRLLSRWALARGESAFRARAFGPTGKLGIAQAVADRLLGRQIRKQLGIDKLTLAATGGAPANPRTLEFFAALGVRIYEGYGLSEAMIATLPEAHQLRIGTVGKPIPGTELRIASDGEIELRGTSVIDGYYLMPHRTREAFTEDGWLRTGDLGVLDDQGYLRITGRKREMVITSGGRSVVPAGIERRLNQVPGIAHAVIVGDGRPHLCALVALDPDELPALAQQLRIEATTVDEAARHQAVQNYVAQNVMQASQEQGEPLVRDFVVLPNAFSIEGGELTPQMNPRRQAVLEKYRQAIDTLYLP